MNKKITMIVLSVILGICILLFGYTYIKYTNIVKLNSNLKEEIKKIDNDTERDHYLSSSEALEYGIVDKVLN